MPKHILKTISCGILVMILFWIAISTIIQRLRCPAMTETELLLNLPNSFIGDWACKK